MALPELPETFGNPALGEIAEIVPAAGISWTPQTPGWYVIGLIVLFFVGRRVWRVLTRWYRNRYRREALRRLGQAGLTTRAVNETLKLAAITASSREEVAPLSGSDWTHWLQGRCESPVFSDASLTELGERLYQDAAGAAERSLIAEAQTWLKTHRDSHA